MIKKKPQLINRLLQSSLSHFEHNVAFFLEAAILSLTFLSSLKYYLIEYQLVKFSLQLSTANRLVKKINDITQLYWEHPKCQN